MQLTLEAKYYTDPGYFRIEMEEIFFRGWICVGRANEIPKPGDYVLRELGKESLIITRDETGRIRAHYNVCRHRGTRLCEKERGSFKGRIACPYHAWTYALDGRLTGAPHMSEVAGFKMEDFPLHQAACDTWDGYVWVSMAKEPLTLRDHLGALHDKFRNWRSEELELGRRISYDVKANWKLIVQNYSECLHCPVIHPGLKRLTNYMSGDNEPVSSTYLGGTMTINEGVKTMSKTGDTKRDPLPGLTAEQRRLVYYYWVSPNLLLSLHPDYVMTHTLWPKAPDLTTVVCELHFHPAEIAKPDFDFSDAGDFWDEVNREDWKVSELSQLGISSRAYTPGPYSRREGLLHGLDRILTERMKEVDHV